ncbi:hypothetical protein CWATWH0005_1350 [Crocosphaera watsonii WH 0005]|uniref:Uncharacterized protein n=2 Tax=Crocosphaera watsonii TaxID=263511 RepID=T2J1D3_CROWT|nr:hypothetical protein CWATWH0005_1350 [Crocosphaera watsonii WH 0005]
MPLDFKGLALVAFGSVASTVLLTGTAQAQMAANANYGATLGGVNFDGNLGGITEFNFDGMIGLVDTVPPGLYPLPVRLPLRHLRPLRLMTSMLPQ